MSAIYAGLTRQTYTLSSIKALRSMNNTDNTAARTIPDGVYDPITTPNDKTAALSRGIKDLRPARAAYFKEQRELHRLYNKHEPRYMTYENPLIGVCSCGRLLTYVGDSWVTMNHATKKNVKRNLKAAAWIKKVQRPGYKEATT
jgi:hypothetical protein